ncbi:MAG: GSCFA domain-containing protein [Flavobacteriales bacterium]|nr:GSCFA domain-containing protein [Flavobacteriales bacterium]
MMKWCTEIPITPLSQPVGFEARWLLSGSCFAAEMGGKLVRSRMDAVVNPYGVIFHPIPLFRGLLRALQGKEYTLEDVVYAQGKWVSYDHQGIFSSEDRNALLQELNDHQRILAGRLASCEVIAITWGTAWAYRYLTQDVVVANCHKLPQSDFGKELSSIDHLANAALNFQKALYEVNPQARVIVTVSPVRHWKDGATQNQRSKAHLLAAAWEVVDQMENWDYFPAYEIMMDELRDYRFYKEDLLHPSEVAVNEIWSRFRNAAFNKATLALLERLEPHLKLIAHRDGGERHKAKCRIAEEQIDAEIRHYQT